MFHVLMFNFNRTTFEHNARITTNGALFAILDLYEKKKTVKEKLKTFNQKPTKDGKK